MEEAEPSRYVAQLKAEFDGCDTTATGFLDRQEVTSLCRKLQLDAHLPLLLSTLLGGRAYARVNFEEFKDGFVTVLSRSLDVCTSEDDSSYLEPVVPEEVKPKFVKGAKRYGRRSCPDSKPDAALACDLEESPPSRDEAAPSRDEAADASPVSVHGDKLRRATSLESVESLKSDEDAGSQKPDFQSKAPLQEEEEEPDQGGGGGHVSLNTEELDSLLRKLDAGLEGRVSIRDFQKFLRGSAPISCSTPVRATDLQRAPHRSQTLLEERSARCTSPSLLTATVGQRVLSRLDDGSGCTSPERVIVLWTEEGIRNSRDILQTLDFPLEERLSLADLTLALDNELLVSGNAIQQAALISYKNEIQHLQVMAEQACRERDKVRVNLDLADQRNLKLVREVDERHTSMETLNQSRIRDLELDFRDRLAVLRTQSEQESEALLQQAERERSVQQGELQLLRVQETQLQEELCSGAQENSRLEDELSVVKMKLTEAENSVNKLQRDMKQLLHDKFGGVDPAGAGLSHEERFREVVKEYELQFRELRDRNDELSSELLKSQRSNRKSRRDDDAALSWTEQHSVSAESDSDDLDMKRHSSPLVKKKMQLDEKSGLDSVAGPVVSIQTELALEQLKQKHNQELQQLHIQLDTQVNYYERSLELMRQSMEVERKDISQAFKLEISELEEHKAQAEAQVEQLKEAVDKLQTPHGGGGGGGGGWSSEQERRVQRERAELEQNFAREIGHLVQRLSAEKDELEAELKLHMDQEVMVLRTQLEELGSENVALQERLKVLQQEVQNLEEHVAKKRRKLEEMEGEHERSREEEERLHRENSKYREEVLDLSSRNLQLSSDNAELSARLHGDQESARMLGERLATVSKEKEEERATVRRLQEAAAQQERETLQQQTSWTQERHLLEKELNSGKDKLGRLSELEAELEAELSAVTLKLQWLEEDKAKRLRDADDRSHKVETLQQSLLTLESEAELLRSQLHAVSREKLGHAQEVTDLQRALHDARNKVEDLETSIRTLMMEKEEQASVALQEEEHRQSVQEQELQHKLTELRLQSEDVHKLTQEQQKLKNKVSELEMARTQAENQAQHMRQLQEVQEERRRGQQLQEVQEERRRSQQLQEVQERASGGRMEQVEQLQVRLLEERRRSQQLEETLKLQAQQSSSQISVKQDQFEKAVASMQQRTEDLELKLKAVRSVLQEKVQEVKEQMAKNAKSSVLLKDVYVENSQLMKVLQVTEQRQKNAEKNNFLLKEKVGALNRLLREIVPVSLAT